MLDLKKLLVIPFFSLICSVCFSQNKPENIIWGEKLKKTNALSEFIYKNENLYTLNHQLKSIQKFSPDKLILLETLSLEGMMGKLDGHSFDLYESIKSLIEYKDGLGLLVEYTSKADKKKYFGFFEININLSKFNTEGQILFQIDLGKNEEFQNSDIYMANENYQAIFSSNTVNKVAQYKGQLDVVSRNGVVNSREFTYDDEESKNGRNFTFAKEAYLIQEWTETTNDVKLYEGTTNALISTFSINEFLEHDGRILSMEKQSNGEYILAGFYGKFDKKGNEIMGLFRIILTKEGVIDTKLSDVFLMSEIATTQESSSVDDVLITEAGDLFFILTSNTGAKGTINGAGGTIFEQLMVVGIHIDEIWSKSIPFRQGYGTMIFQDHLGPKVIEKDGHLLLSFNDHRKNGKNFDYNHFEYSTDNRPDKYTCTLPDVITIIDIDNKGNVEPYFIDVFEIFVNLTRTILLDDGTVFITGNAATLAGAGKSRFAKIKLN